MRLACWKKILARVGCWVRMWYSWEFTCQAFEKFVIMCFRVTVDHSDLSISPDSDAVSLGLMVHKVRKYSYTWRFGPAPASQKIHLP